MPSSGVAEQSIGKGRLVSLLLFIFLIKNQSRASRYAQPPVFLAP